MKKIRFEKSVLVLSYWIEFMETSILPLDQKYHQAVNKAGLGLGCFPEFFLSETSGSATRKLWTPNCPFICFWVRFKDVSPLHICSIFAVQEAWVNSRMPPITVAKILIVKL